ncbi:MAG: DUF4279 domain-containing protein [Thermoleophilia bacterium]
MHSTDYDDTYPTCDDTYCTLCIYHDDLEPEKVNRLLGLDHTWSCKKGDPIFPKEPDKARRKTGAWLFRTEGIVNSKDSRRHVDWPLDTVEDKAETLAKMMEQGYSVRISCYWSSLHGHGGPTVSVVESKRLGRLGIELDFDVYFSFDEYEEA